MYTYTYVSNGHCPYKITNRLEKHENSTGKSYVSIIVNLLLSYLTITFIDPIWETILLYGKTLVEEINK